MLLTLVAFAFALGLLITFHELGHYTVARLCGVPIQRFSVGFGPVLLRRMDRHGTEWALSAVPLGGYVKMLDDAPAGADEVTRRAAFNQQPLGRRTLVVLAGPVANLLLAVILYAVVGMWGAQEPVALLGAPGEGTPAASAGIVAGSLLKSVDGSPVESWNQARWQLMESLTVGGTVSLGVQSPGEPLRTIALQVAAHSPAPGDVDPLRQVGLVLAPGVPVIGTLTPGGVAAQAGLRPGDRIVSVAGVAHPTIQQFIATVQAHAGRTLALQASRAGVVVSLTLVPHPEDDGQGHTVGRIGTLIQAERPLVLVRQGPLQSVATGVQRTAEMSVLTLRMLGRMVVGTASWRNISGPVTIAEYAGQSVRVGLDAYLGFLALISISIGVLNLLPIPLLDGGHLLFYLMEALRGGRPVPDKVRDVGLRLGMATVVALMILALFNDFSRLFS